MKTAVVAETLSRAREVAAQLGVARPYLMSPRSIACGSGRGLMLDVVLIHDSALPLREIDRATIEPCLHARGGRMFEIREAR